MIITKCKNLLNRLRICSKRRFCCTKSCAKISKATFYYI